MLGPALEQLEAAGQLQPVGLEFRVGRAAERRERPADPGGIDIVGGNPAFEEPGPHCDRLARRRGKRDRPVRSGLSEDLITKLVERHRLHQIQLGKRLIAAPAQLVAGLAGLRGGRRRAELAQPHDRELVADVADRTEVIARIGALEDARIHLRRLVVLPLLERVARELPGGHQLLIDRRRRLRRRRRRGAPREQDQACQGERRPAHVRGAPQRPQGRAWSGDSRVGSAASPSPPPNSQTPRSCTSSCWSSAMVRWVWVSRVGSATEALLVWRTSPVISGMARSTSAMTWLNAASAASALAITAGSLSD